MGGRPRNAVTVLDTHDGIGVVDVGADPGGPLAAGLLGDAQIDALVEAIHANSGGTSARATGAAASNVDLYQVNCTFYDALGRDDARYLLARALQLFTPGHPQIHYVGLLAGGNDMDLLARTNVGRDVNRHHYAPDEVLAALERPVVRAQLDLLRARSSPAFDGDWSAGGTDAAPELRFAARAASRRWCAICARASSRPWCGTRRASAGSSRCRGRPGVAGRPHHAWKSRGRPANIAWRPPDRDPSS